MAFYRCAGGTDPTGDAGVGDVLAGKTFSNADGIDKTGTMTNRGAVSQSLNTSTTSYTIPAGYHNGSGKVSITTQEKTVTSSRSAQTVTPDSGKVLSKVTVNALTPTGTYKPTARANNNNMGATGNYRYVDTTAVPNSNSGTYTYAANSTGGTVDMGATNTYRYVNATNVYNKGKADGAFINSYIDHITGINGGDNSTKTISCYVGDIVAIELYGNLNSKSGLTAIREDGDVAIYKTTGTSFTLKHSGSRSSAIHIASPYNLASKVSVEFVYGQTAKINKTVKIGDLYVSVKNGLSAKSENTYIIGVNEGYQSQHVERAAATTIGINPVTGNGFKGYLLRF